MKLDINKTMGKLPYAKFKVWYSNNKLADKTGVSVEDAYKSVGGKVK